MKASLFYFSVSFLLRRFCETLEKKEWIWIIGTNLKFKNRLIFLVEEKRFLFYFRLLFEDLWIIWKFYQNLKIGNLEEDLKWFDLMKIIDNFWFLFRSKNKWILSIFCY